MSESFDRLVEVLQKLRSPEGCLWDREQTHRSILPALLDESYEFFDAVDANDCAGMKEELGDILLQVIFHSQIAHEEKKFSIDEVVEEITEKLIRRHPHVFADTSVNSSADIIDNWERIKRTEKGKQDRKSVVDGIPKALPALARAEKVQERVKRCGFDWAEIAPVLDKVEEEFAEFREALENNDQRHKEEEFGDILFSLVNVARFCDISAEESLRSSTNKFMKRFMYIEDFFGGDPEKIKAAGFEELNRLWDESKKQTC